MKRYLEEVVKKMSSEHAVELIRDENERLQTSRRLKAIRNNPWIEYVMDHAVMEAEQILPILEACGSFEEFCDSIAQAKGTPSYKDFFYKVLRANPSARQHFNVAREAIGSKGFRMREKRSQQSDDENVDSIE